MACLHQWSNDQSLQESAYLLRKHPKGLADADDSGRCDGDRKTVELVHQGANLVRFKVIENVCRKCWHEPARFLSNNNTMELRLHTNAFFPVKDGGTYYLFGAISSRCINCHRPWLDGGEEIGPQYHLILHSSYSLSQDPRRAAELDLPQPLVIKVGELRSGWKVEDHPRFSPYITEAQGADLFSIDLPSKSTIEAVVENGYVTYFRRVDRRCNCGKTPWSIDRPGGQRWTTIRNAWFIPVVIDKVCYRFCDVSIHCGSCKKPWADLPPGEEKRPYALLLLDTLAARLIPRGTIAPLQLQKSPTLPKKQDKEISRKVDGHRSLISKVIHRNIPAKAEDPGNSQTSHIFATGLTVVKVS